MITRWEMIKAVWGSLDEWREACERAKADGWTPAEVQWIIDLFRPSATPGASYPTNFGFPSTIRQPSLNLAGS